MIYLYLCTWSTGYEFHIGVYKPDASVPNVNIKKSIFIYLKKSKLMNL